MISWWNDSFLRWQVRLRMFHHQYGLCHWCSKPMTLWPFKTTRRGRVKDANLFASFEHLERLRDGGKWDLANLRLAHAGCNRGREEKEREAWQDKLLDYERETPSSLSLPTPSLDLGVGRSKEEGTWPRSPFYGV